MIKKLQIEYENIIMAIPCGLEKTNDSHMNHYKYTYIVYQKPVNISVKVFKKVFKYCVCDINNLIFSGRSGAFKSIVHWAEKTRPKRISRISIK